MFYIFSTGSYEIVFDDGCHWTCKVSRLYKLRQGKEGVSSGAPNSPSTPSPQYATGPTNATPQTNAYPAYHTHLFDPTRDYLGSKSERREMKRKLNIKEIFNIGQKKPKTPKVDKDKQQNAPVVRKPRIIRRKTLKLKKKETPAEVKPENSGEYITQIVISIKLKLDKCESYSRKKGSLLLFVHFILFINIQQKKHVCCTGAPLNKMCIFYSVF